MSFGDDDDLDWATESYRGQLASSQIGELAKAATEG